jgi:hypothetical protein
MKIAKCFDYTPTPWELAQEFCNFDDTEQAAFFNYIHEIFETKKGELAQQLQFLCDNKYLTREGREVMRLIGEYSDLTEK